MNSIKISRKRQGFENAIEKHCPATFVTLFLFAVLSTLVCFIAPKVAAILVPIAAVSCLIIAAIYRTKPLHVSNLLLLGFLPLMFVVIESASRATDVSLAFTRATHLFLYFTCALALTAGVFRVNNLGKQAILAGAIISLAAGSFILIVDMFLPGGISAILKELYLTKEINEAWTNRPAVTIVLLFLPAFAWLWRSNKIDAIALLAIVSVGVLGSISETAMLALIVGIVVWILASVMPVITTWIVSVGTIVTIWLMPWSINFLYKLLEQTGLIHWREGTILARLEIWRFVTAFIKERPISGWGLEFIRPYKIPVQLSGGEILMSPLHPHNAVLQIWLEMGATGALAVSIFLSAILWSILKMDKTAKALCLPVFSAVYVVACVSHGLWQSWWLGLLATVAMLVFVAMGHNQSPLRSPSLRRQG